MINLNIVVLHSTPIQLSKLMVDSRLLLPMSAEMRVSILK